MPTCTVCRRFVVIGSRNAVCVSGNSWAHRECPPDPTRQESSSRVGGPLNGRNVHRLATSPSAHIKFMTTGRLD